MPKVWLITGASSGFGLAMTRVVLESGDVAVATLRKPEVLNDLTKQYPSSQLLVLPLDVQDSTQVNDTFARVRTTFGRLDVVFNNAGYGVFAEVEGTPENVARTMFDTNFWGAANVSREAVKFFREENGGVGGRLIVNSSIAGVYDFPSAGYYSASKAALDAVHIALWRELDPAWNIKVTIVLPGKFRTNALNVANSQGPASPHPAYTNPTLPSVIARKGLDTVQAGDVKKAAQIFKRLGDVADPPLLLPLGKDAVEMYENKMETLQKDLEGAKRFWADNLEADD